MKKQLNYQTIEWYGVKLTLGYTEEGRRISDDPTDRHEVTIHKITAYDSDIDLSPLLEAYIEEIYELLNDKI
jgi:hypothetical protein